VLIDCHTHVGALSEPRIRPFSEKLEYWRTQPPKRMLEWMDEHGIDRAVLLPLESPECGGPYRTTNEVLEVADAYPDRFVPFCVVDPRVRVYDVDTRELFASILEQYVAEGARGFGEIKCEVPIDDDRMQVLYELCGDYDLPMLFHLDDQSMMDEVGLPGLERMLRAYPDTDFIMHSHGWWSHVSADVRPADLARGAMPDAPVEEGGRCDELLSEYDNVYADVSAGSGWNALTRDREYTERFLDRHHEQILFGSDRLGDYDPPTTAFFEEFELSEDAARNVAHRNVERLLR
jgi:hypothetical protein